MDARKRSSRIKKRGGENGWRGWVGGRYLKVQEVPKGPQGT